MNDSAKNKGARSIIALILAAASLLCVFAGCNPVDNELPEEPAVQEEEFVNYEPADDIEDINAAGINSVYQIGDYIYFYDQEINCFTAMTADGVKGEPIQRFRACGSFAEEEGKLYMSAVGTKEGVDYAAIYCYDPQTNEINEVIGYPVQTGEDGTTNKIHTFCVKDGVIYYAHELVTFVDYRDLKETELRRVDVNGENDEVICSLAQVCNLSWNSTMTVRLGKLYFAGRGFDARGHLYCVDLETGELSDVDAWGGNHGDVFTSSRGVMYIGISDYDVWYFGLGEDEENSIDDSNTVASLHVYNEYVFFGMSQVVFSDDLGKYSSAYGIYRYNTASGETEVIYDGFCEILGVADGWVYFYDRSSLEEADDLQEFGRAHVEYDMYRVSIDGGEPVELAEL